MPEGVAQVLGDPRVALALQATSARSCDAQLDQSSVRPRGAREPAHEARLTERRRPR